MLYYILSDLVTWEKSINFPCYGSCPEALYNLGSGSWLAWANDTDKYVMQPTILELMVQNGHIPSHPVLQ